MQGSKGSKWVRARLVYVVTFLGVVSCGDIASESVSGGVDSGSPDSSAHEGGSGSVDASGHDGGLRNGGSPDSEAAACISNDDMCKSLGLPSPCWYCPPGFLKKCASTAGTCNDTMGFLQCLTCDHGVGTEYQCEGDPPHWVAQTTMTCSE